MNKFSKEQVEEALQYITPDQISDNQGWFNFTCACVAGGISETDWDAICQTAPNYDYKENHRRWNSIDPNTGITSDYIVGLAFKNGYRTNQSSTTLNGYNEGNGSSNTMQSASSHNYDTTEFPKVDKNVTDYEKKVTYSGSEVFTEEERIAQAMRYIKAVYKPADYVNVHFSYNTTIATTPEGMRYYKYGPSDGGITDYTAQELIDNLEDSTGTLEDEFSIPEGNPAGVWFGINGMKKHGTKASDVTSYDNVLIESDTMSITEQIAFYYASKLPIKAITCSGGKSVHAIVSVNAKDSKQYDERVKLIYKFLKENNFEADEANKNPNRLSRAAGFMRGLQCQALIDTNVGLPNFDSWLEEMQFQKFSEQFGKSKTVQSEDFAKGALPDWLIEGVMREKEVSMVVGKPKVGKSLMAMQMALCVASGRKYFEHNVKKSKVLYCNLEISERWFEERVKEFQQKMALSDDEIEDFYTLTMTGKLNSNNCDNFLEYLKIQIKRETIGLVVLDPIYILESCYGIDENDSVAVTTLLDKIASVKEETGASVLFVHHISSKVRDMSGYDADSLPQGSSAFARFYDNLVAIQELDLDGLAMEFQKAKRAFRIAYSSRNSEASPYDSVWGTYPSYTNAFNKPLTVAPLQTPATLEKREKERQKQFEEFKICTDQSLGWDDIVA